jgi:phage host-nuclease inhibitor protein Gam
VLFLLENNGKERCKLSVGTTAQEIPQTLEDADKVVSRIRKRRVQNAADKARIEEIDAEAKQLRGKIRAREVANEADQKLVQAFADAHRDELTEQGKVKNFRFRSGAVGRWYLPSRATLIIGDNLAAITRALLRLKNWRDFVDISFKKDYIKAHLDELHEASPTLRKGFRIEKKELFRIDT